MTRKEILIVEDEPDLRQVFVDILMADGYDISTAADGEMAIQMLGENSYDLVLIDLYLPKADGFQVLAHLQRVSSSTSAIVMTGHGSIESAVEAMKKGAVDYITKPVAFDQLRIVVKKALDVRRLQQENRLLRHQLKTKYRFENLVGTSPAMQQLFQLIEKVAEGDDTLMERFFDQGGLSQEELLDGLKREVLARQIYPVVFTSASHNIAGHALLDTIVSLLPAADATATVVGTTNGREMKLDRKPDAAPCALVFKTMSDPFSGRVSLFRVYSGTLQSDHAYWNVGREHEERIGKLQVLQGKQQLPVPELRAGDLVFFHNTWDFNGDGLVNDPLTHVGVVERVEGDGTVVFVSRVSRGIQRFRMNVRAPDTHRTSDGRVLNDFMRRKGTRDPQATQYLTGQLFAAFGTLLR